MIAKTHQEKLDDIHARPERHKHHDVNALIACCMVNGAIDGMLMEEHPAQGYNGGQKCDVRSGPCSCGGWH